MEQVPVLKKSIVETYLTNFRTMEFPESMHSEQLVTEQDKVRPSVRRDEISDVQWTGKIVCDPMSAIWGKLLYVSYSQFITCIIVVLSLPSLLLSHLIIKPLSLSLSHLTSPVCRTSLLKALWEKEKLLVTSDFSFTHGIFHHFGELSVIFIKSKLVYKLFQTGRVSVSSFGKSLIKWI